MSYSRLEKFIYAICSMDVSDLPVPLSRIEKLWNCLITGETPDFEPLSRNEKYLMAMLDCYDISNLPAPMSRGEKLLYKIAVGETDLSDVPGYLSRYEELLKYLIENGGIGGGDFEYVLHTLNQSLSTLYTTAEKPVKSAILKGNTGYRDIDTGEILETFEEGRNLELVSVKMPVLQTTGKNLICIGRGCDYIIRTNGLTITRDIASQTITFDGTANSNNVSYSLDTLFRQEIKKGERYAMSCFLVSGTADNISFRVNTKNWSSSMGCSVGLPVVKAFNQDIVYDGCTFRVDKGMTFNNAVFRVMFEKVKSNSNKTSYEPYKSNILTVNEPIELRGIGDVQDTLNCLTGEIIERIGEIVLDGSQDWNSGGTSNWNNDGNTIGFYIKYYKTKNNIGYSDKLLLMSNIKKNDTECFYINSTQNWIGIRLLKSKLSELTDKGLKAYLQSNPVTIQYQLATESTKTIDISTVDQNNQPAKLGTFENITHVSLEAENLIPTLEMEVATRISEELESASPLMDDISNEQQQLEETVDEQSNNVDATMIATTEIFEETL